MDLTRAEQAGASGAVETGILVVGQAPSRRMRPGAWPLTGTSALTRLAGYAGVAPRERLYELADFINLLQDYPGVGPDPKYDAFPEDAAAAGLDRVHQYIAQTRPKVVVTLGAKVALAFGAELSSGRSGQVDWLLREPCVVGSHRFMLVHSPHPGGTSMWWNDPINRASGAGFWRALLGPGSAAYALIYGHELEVTGTVVEQADACAPGLRDSEEIEMGTTIKGYVVTTVADGEAAHEGARVGASWCTVVAAENAAAARRAASEVYKEKYGTVKGVKFTAKHHVALDQVAQAKSEVA